MYYPKIIKKINNGIAVVCGCRVVVIALFTIYEMISRGAFGAPTTWTINFSTYILIWYAFMGSSYSFQAHGHVGVDLFKDLVDKKSEKHTARKIMAIVGYVCSLLYIVVLLIGGINLCRKSIQFNQMTATLQPIPMIILNLAVVVGCIWMIITIIAILMDLIGGGKEYL